jgi:hypothetical protein
MSPEVSVVVIFRNEERFLGEAVDSICAQDFDDWELILVDDGSIDASPDIARERAAKDSRIRFVQHPGGVNLGMSASRNLGVAHARGSFIAFCDADDVWLPHKLRHQLAEIGGDQTLAMTYGPILRWHTWTDRADARFEEDLCGVGPKKRGKHPYAGRIVEPPALVPLIIRSDYYCPSGGLIRTEALHSVGGFEDRFRGMHEDGVMYVKLCAQHRVHVSEEVTYLYRMHPGQHTHSVVGPAETAAARRPFVMWADAYLAAEGRHTRTTRAAVLVARAKIGWKGRPAWIRLETRRRGVSALRLLGRTVLPVSVRDAVRDRWFAYRRPRASVELESASQTRDPETAP